MTHPPPSIRTGAAGIVVALWLLGAHSAFAGRSEEPDFKTGIAQATYSAPDRSIYDFITFDAVRASVERSAVELALNSPDGALLLLGRALVDFDPFAHLSLSVSNPYDTEVQVFFTLSLPTSRLIDTQWQARSRLELQLFDDNGDGASAAPVLVIAPADPRQPPEARFMDTGVSLAFGGLVYFGGPPVAPLGADALWSAPDGTASFSLHSSAPTLPSHAWIGPDVAWNTMSTSLGLRLSAHDRVQIRADLDITPVPEPATWALWLAGAVALLQWRRRAA